MPGLILLASYPKSGNTWLRFVLDSFLRGGEAVDINSAPFVNAAARTIVDRMLGMESADLRESDLAAIRPRLWAQAARAASQSAILKTHDAFMASPLGPAPFEPTSIAAVIHVVRDPRDVAVSFAHHLGVSVDEAITAMADDGYVLSGEPDRHRPNLPQFLSSWSGHVESWLGADSPVTTVRYEDMRDHPQAAFGAAFAAVGLAADTRALQRAIVAAGFETLQAQERTDGFTEHRPGASEPFFRKGIAGGWRSALSAAQAARIERDHGVVMARLGYA